MWQILAETLEHSWTYTCRRTLIAKLGVRILNEWLYWIDTLPRLSWLLRMKCSSDLCAGNCKTDVLNPSMLLSSLIRKIANSCYLVFIWLQHTTFTSSLDCGFMKTNSGPTSTDDFKYTCTKQNILGHCLPFDKPTIKAEDKRYVL